MLDPREDAKAYMKEHSITKLFQELGTRVMYHRPEDPNNFLLEVLGSLSAAKKQGVHAAFFTPQDLDAMFSLYDPTDRGHISRGQYQDALKTLGVNDSKIGLPKSDRVGKPEFRALISRELQANSVTTA